MKKKLLMILAMSMLVLNLSGCRNNRATITTTVYPVRYLVEQLGGDKVNVQYLSTDEFVQRARLVNGYDTILSNTDLLIYIDEIEPYFDAYDDLLSSYDFEVMNLSSLSAVYDFRRYTTTVVNGVSVTRESDYYDSDLFNHVDTYQKDPFLWLDPIAMSSMAFTIKEWLEAYYPEDSLVIEAKFKSLQETLVRMDAEYQELKKLRDVKLVTVTASFGNWQKIYGVEVYPLILSRYGVLPTEAQLAYIEQVIRDNEVKYIVADDTLPEYMQTLCTKVMADCNLTAIELSSLSRLSAQDVEKNKSYTTIMYENLSALERTFSK